MTKALVTCANHPGVYFLEKWLPQFQFVYGDASFIGQNFSSESLILPEISQADYIHQLLNICLDQQIEMVFAMCFAEQELLAEAVELFSEFNIQLHLPDLLTRKSLSDQAAMFEKLNFNGIKTAPFRITSSFAEFSKACLQLGYPTESIAVASLLNLEFVWIINDQLKTNSVDGKPVIPFTKAAKLFATEEILLLRKYHPSTQKINYASFTGGKLETVWNEKVFSEEITKIGLQLQLNGLFEITFQQEQLFNLKPFFVT